MSHQEHVHRKKIKIVVYVPESHTAALRDAMGDAGAGIIGKYSHCMFTIKGVSQFKPLSGSNPVEGTIGEISEVVEDRIETVCMKDSLEDVLAAINKVHPYEEPAVDVYPIEEINQK
jgi:hypothetical protein